MAISTSNPFDVLRDSLALSSLQPVGAVAGSITITNLSDTAVGHFERRPFRPRARPLVAPVAQGGHVRNCFVSMENRP
jgi:hypothetical protein